jgi:general transcription factor IIIA
VCLHEKCGKSFGYKHLLQRHTAKAHTDSSSSNETENGVFRDEGSKDTELSALDIDLVTGKAYTQRSRVNGAKFSLNCPWPNIDQLDSRATSTFSVASSNRVATANSGSLPDHAACDYVFSRFYDLCRHLKSEHGFDPERTQLERWTKS